MIRVKMKRARLASDPDDPVSHSEQDLDDQPEEKASNHVSPLDVNNFKIDWPIWRQEFQILLETRDPVPERKKLAIFLNCLGRAGIGLATAFFPQLKDFGAAEAEKITFDMVWSRFDDHCASIEAESRENSFLESYKFFEAAKNRIGGVDVLYSYSKLLSAAENCDFKCEVCHNSYSDRIIRDQLVRVVHDEDIVAELLELQNPNIQDVIAKHQEIRTDQEIWAEILPYLSLCDIDTVAQMSPRLERIVNKYLKTEWCSGLQIEPCCLQKHSLYADKDFYVKYGSKNKCLHLLSLRQSEANQILQFFTEITRLVLFNMEILEDLDTFPTKLYKLNIFDCVIERLVLEKWFTATASTLRMFTMENVTHSFPLRGNVGRLGKPLLMNNFEQIYEIKIRGESLNLNMNNCDVDSLFIQSNDIVNCKFGNVEAQYLDWLVPNPESLLSDNSGLRTSLTVLTLYNWNHSMDLTKFECLEYLQVLSKVDPIFKPEIEKLRIKDVLVTYIDSNPDPKLPEEPNLMFELLNDDCLLEIMSFLTVPQWMTFGEVHPRSEWVVTNYKYPRAEITTTNCVYQITKSHFFDICPFISRFVLQSASFVNHLQMFIQLTTLTIRSFIITKEMADQLPTDLEKLCLNNNYEKDLNLSPYFQKINTTLRVLEVRSLPDNGQCLMELRQLREIKIVVTRSFEQLPLILKQNTSLERVDIRLKWFISEEICDAIASLRHLNDLNISLDNFMGEFKEHFIGLLKKIGPQLTKLSVDINYGSFIFADLPNIKELIVNVEGGLKWAVEGICTLKSLRKLRIKKYEQIDGWRSPETTTGFVLLTSDLMLLVQSLPNLIEIQSIDLEPFTIRRGLELQEYLRRNNRELRINSVQV